MSEAKNNTGSRLLAGAAKVEITPELGIQIAGDIGRRRPVEKVDNPLYARVLVLEMGPTRMCLVSLDLCATNLQWTERIRQAAGAKLNCPAAAVMVHSVQNHGAPDLGRFIDASEHAWLTPDLWWLCGGDERYEQVTFDRIISAVEQAGKKLKPVRLQLGRGMEGRVAFNRRFIMRNGTARCHPPRCAPDILCCEGPIDPEVGLASFVGDDGHAVAALLHFTCHPTHHYPTTTVGADWPGLWAERVSPMLGPDCIALPINGFCGNVHTTNHLDLDARADDLSSAAKLAQTTRRILEGPLPPRAVDTLTYVSRKLPIPLRKLDSKLIDAAEDLLRQHPQPIWLDAEKTRVDWSWCYAVDRMTLKRLHERERFFECELGAWRIGDLALVCAPGEPFVEAQLQIKLHSPAAFTFMVHMTYGDAGYIPTAAAIERGGYETDLSSGSKLAPEALEMITQSSLELLKQLYA
ncbi:MAG: hypothetical protein IT443_08960 [Phycisphaeraceae bacterium]|nr:hypothetical protein [Phycisphaeraceae bacterium]